MARIPMQRDFLVSRDDLAATCIVERPVPDAPDDGDVLLRVDRFALTANNITYALLGRTMSYWDFFPVPEADRGLLPAWGYATVVASRVEGIAAGERFYGFVPMSTHVRMRPARVTAGGFVDGSDHRQTLHALYNQYVRCATDPLHDPTCDPAREDVQLLLRPLFITSFVVDDLLADRGFDGARAVLLSSASSKTAFGAAWRLSLRRPGGPEVIGLTSSRNVAFVAGLGCYDRVVAYDRIATLPADLPVAFVDFAGDRELRGALHRHFGPSLRASLVVGAAHGEAGWPDADEGLPGSPPETFFAPSQIRKRNAEWGAAVFRERFAAAWRAFAERVADPARPWLVVSRAAGPRAVVAWYGEALAGAVRPDEGRIASLHEATGVG